MTLASSSAEFEAWGGRMRVVVTEPAALAAALESVRRVVEDFDDACSSFRDDSELARLNAAGGREVAAGPLLLDAIEAALRAAEVTDGDVDPTVGDALVAYGFTPPLPPAVAAPTAGARAWERARAGGASPAVHGPGSGRIVRVPGHQTIEIDRGAATVRIGREVRLDLGATAKALAADRAAAAARAATGAGVLVSLSGDVAIAGPPPADGWSIRVTDDHRAGPGAPGQTIALREGGLATSSTTVRVGPAGHHLIDPSTGGPAAVHFRTVSVAAATCLDANIATTAAIVRGRRGDDWLRSLRLPSRVVSVDGAVRHLFGWPADGEDLPVEREPVVGAA